MSNKIIRHFAEMCKPSRVGPHYDATINEIFAINRAIQISGRSTKGQREKLVNLSKQAKKLDYLYYQYLKKNDHDRYLKLRSLGFYSKPLYMYR